MISKTIGYNGVFIYFQTHPYPILEFLPIFWPKLIGRWHFGRRRVVRVVAGVGIGGRRAGGHDAGGQVADPRDGVTVGDGTLWLCQPTKLPNRIITQLRRLIMVNIPAPWVAYGFEKSSISSGYVNSLRLKMVVFWVELPIESDDLMVHLMGCNGIYPLVICYIAIENDHS